MEQLNIFSLEDEPQEKKKTGLLYRCHLYRNDQIAYTTIPTLQGVKLIGIRSSEVLNMSLEEYAEFIDEKDLQEVGK